MPKPEVPYYDWNVCPGGRMRLQEVDRTSWCNRIRFIQASASANRETQPWRQGNRSHGLVNTWKPGIIRVERDLPEKGFKSGDTILTFACRGEGYSAVWFKGRYFSDFDISFTKWPDGSGCARNCGATYLDLGEKAWWAKVKLASGRIGWVDMDHSDFDGTCALADPAPKRLRIRNTRIYRQRLTRQFGIGKAANRF
ncbi:MAG: hypothetical protein M3Y57_08400 [Acidobacteriota bacterium]|nr:hypothetical protein [Acidobacteriota bacterium]